MARYIFKLPDVGEGTAEAEIVAWHVKPGDQVDEDQNIVDVMTDKATVEMTSPVRGTVVALHGEPGAMAQVGAPLIEFDVSAAGSGTAVPAPQPDAPSPPTIPSPTGETQGRSAPPSVIATPASGGKPLAAPAVRRRAQDLGIALQSVPGTGQNGRITHADLDDFVAAGARPHAPRSAQAPRDDVDEIKLVGLRRKIADKMQQSMRSIPHYTYVDEVDMTELERLRAHLNGTGRADRPKLTVLPFLMRALVKVLPDYRQINARFDDEAGLIRRHAAIHIGIATQTQNGLIVPVVRHAETRDIWDDAREIARLAAAVRDNTARNDELSGSTITITSLGALGGLVTTPVINHPEVAIIGPNAIVERPVVRDGQIVIRKMMNLSASFDHRVVDGYDAAQFVQRIKTLLEQPAALFID